MAKTHSFAVTGPFNGQMRIVEMPTWPADHLDIAGPAYIAFDGEGHGELAFGALTATLDCATTPSGVDFDWAGFDEGDEVTGEGWVELQSDGSLIGEFAYDNGDQSTLKAMPC
jgi:hypothetical protein